MYIFIRSKTKLLPFLWFALTRHFCLKFIFYFVNLMTDFQSIQTWLAITGTCIFMLCRILSCTMIDSHRICLKLCF